MEQNVIRDEKGIIRYFIRPMQVRFTDPEGNRLGGIGFEKYLICGCCGGVFETTDFEDEGVSDIEIFPVWVDISDEITGD